MTRYLVGTTSKGAHAGYLRLTDAPPTFYEPNGARSQEHISWAAASYAWINEGGRLKEWHDEHGRRIIARVFPESEAAELAIHDKTVRLAEEALSTARIARQEFLETVVARAKPVRVATARRERAELDERRSRRADKSPEVNR